MVNNESIERPKELDDLVYAFHRTTNYIDAHLQEFRMGIFGIAIAGTVLTVRGLRVFTRFKRAKNIPSSYIKKNVTLQGIVRRVDPETKTLLVEHEPWMKLWKRKVSQDSLLPVSLGGARLNGLGYQWLDLTMRNKRIDFTLLGVSPAGEAESVVKSTEGILSKRCLNSEAVKLGFAEVAPLNLQLAKNQTYKKLLGELLKMEAKAVNDKNGIWSSSGVGKRTSSIVVFAAVTKFWRFLEEIAKMVSKLKNVKSIKVPV
ncbi:hypothetical protein CHUAL_000723 [Chamberlinius hualienensis]